MSFTSYYYYFWGFLWSNLGPDAENMMMTQVMKWIGRWCHRPELVEIWHFTKVSTQHVVLLELSFAPGTSCSDIQQNVWILNVQGLQCLWRTPSSSLSIILLRAVIKRQRCTEGAPAVYSTIMFITNDCKQACAICLTAFIRLDTSAPQFSHTAMDVWEKAQNQWLRHFHAGSWWNNINYVSEK